MSKILPDIPKQDRELVAVVEDGSAKTFVYKYAVPRPRRKLWKLLALGRTRARKK